MELNKAYKIETVYETHHEHCGQGHVAYLTLPTVELQLPHSFVKQLEDEQVIGIIIDNINAGKVPFLIYRERERDLSHRFDIIFDGKYFNFLNLSSH